MQCSVYCLTILYLVGWTTLERDRIQPGYTPRPRTCHECRYHREYRPPQSWLADSRQTSTPHGNTSGTCQHRGLTNKLYICRFAVRRVRGYYLLLTSGIFWDPVDPRRHSVYVEVVSVKSLTLLVSEVCRKKWTVGGVTGLVTQPGGKTRWIGFTSNRSHPAMGRIMRQERRKCTVLGQ